MKKKCEVLGAAGEKNSKFTTPLPHQNSKFGGGGGGGGGIK